MKDSLEPSPGDVVFAIATTTRCTAMDIVVGGKS